jgi:D-alanine transaminase/branched-chain amino acid aminotransferase
MAKWAFLNNGLIEEEKAALHFRDLSFQRGYGIFDFFRLVENEPLFLDDHLDRFYSSAAGMHLTIPFQREDLKAVLSDLIQKNNLPNTGVRLGLTGGYSEDGFNLGKPNLLIFQHSFRPPTEEQQKRGIKLTACSYQRQLPHIKSIDYLMAIWLQPVRAEKGADDLLYHQHGLISECPRSNFFLVTKENTILTPPENVLKGITRKKLMELAKQHYQVEEREIRLEELQSAREAFITSTTKQILPVRQIDEVVYGSSEVSRHLLQLFRSIYSC